MLGKTCLKAHLILITSYFNNRTKDKMSEIKGRYGRDNPLKALVNSLVG